MTQQHDVNYTIETHSDPFDVASAVESRARDSAIEAMRLRAKPQQVARADGTFAVVDCETCGNEIGLGRLMVAIKNRICVHCATALERKR